MVKGVRPLHDRVLVKRATAQATKGGILLPDSAQEKPRFGEVVAVGPGKTDKKGNVRSMSVRTGDKVVFSSYAGTEVKSDDPTTEYLIMSEDDILGVLA
jgi:chaperonin GroES